MLIFFLILLGIGAYFLFYNKSVTAIKIPNRKSAEEILDERFVNGEIDEEAYKKMKSALNG